MTRVTLEVPRLLRDLLELAPGEVATIEAPSLADAWPAVRARFPKLVPHLWDDHGVVRPHVLLYFNGHNFAWPDVPPDLWRDGGSLRVMMAVSGG